MIRDREGVTSLAARRNGRGCRALAPDTSRSCQMDKEKKLPADADDVAWKGEVGEETQKVRRDRGVVDPEVDDLDDDDPTLPPALRP